VTTILARPISKPSRRRIDRTPSDAPSVSRYWKPVRVARQHGRSRDRPHERPPGTSALSTSRFGAADS
jgi:hypothetical protein